jgi:hypothetical protein
MEVFFVSKPKTDFRVCFNCLLELLLYVYIFLVT